MPNMDAPKALALVQKLMALALNNPNAEEARGAAIKVLELIRDHGLVVQAPQAHKITVVATDLLAELMRQQQAARERQSAAMQNAANGYEAQIFDQMYRAGFRPGRGSE